MRVGVCAYIYIYIQTYIYKQMMSYLYLIVRLNVKVSAHD